MTTTRPETPSTGFDPGLRRVAVAVLTGAIMTLLDTTIVNVAVNTLGHDLHASLSTIQWVFTAYVLALCMTTPLSGWAVDRFGGRNAWVTSLALFIAGSVLCGLAWNATSLIVFRALQGLGGGLLLPVGQTMLAREAGPRRMGRVMSLIGIPAMLAPVAGPVLGGLIVGHLLWRWMFFVNVPICALALVLAVRWLPRDGDGDGQPAGRLDTVGFALLSPGLAALVYGLSRVGEGAGLTSPPVLGGAGCGAVLLACFAVRALRTADTRLLDLRLFRHRAFSGGVGALFVYAGAMFGLTVLLPLYYQLARGDDPVRAGLMIAPFGLGAMVTTLIGGRIADRRGSRGVGITGIAVMAIASLVFTQIGTGTDRATLLGATFVVGLGHGLVTAPLTAALYQSLPRAAMATATTTANILVRVGGSFGTALLAVVLQISIRAEIPGASGRLDETAAIRGPEAVEGLLRAFGSSFWWAAGLAVVAIVPALLLPPRRSGESSPPVS